jgi:hypothetical protein
MKKKIAKDSNDGKLRILIAGFLFWAMMSGGGVIGAYVVVHGILLLIGGIELIARIWQSNESGYLWVLYTGIFVGCPGGAITGVWGWATLMRKTRLISDAQIQNFGW